MKIPQIYDIYEINSSVSAVVINSDEFMIEMLCKNKFTGKTYYQKEILIDSDDIEQRYSIFNSKYKYLGQSKILDTLFEIKK